MPVEGKPRRTNKRWHSLEDLRREMTPIVAELGQMPTQRELIQRGRSDLIGAIHKYGGYAEVATALGYPYSAPKSWESVDSLRLDLGAMVAELGRMPTAPELTSRGRSDLRNAVQKFGGFPKVARALGYKYGSRKSWKSTEDLRIELLPFVAELGRMPTLPELWERGRFDLANAIKKFGGPYTVALKIGSTFQSRRTWRSAEELRAELDPIVAELESMPRVEDLKARARFDLVRAINKFGGFRSVAEALEYPYDRYRAWNSVHDLRSHLDPIVAELGRMPTQDQLLGKKRADLVNAVRKFGGILKVAEGLGYPYEFAPALERRARYKKLEAAILELHRAQQLSAGQVMIILRHAGLLSRRDFAEVAEKLQTGPRGDGSSLETDLDELADVLTESCGDSDRPGSQTAELDAASDGDSNAPPGDGPAWDDEARVDGDQAGATPANGADLGAKDGEDSAGPADLDRNRALESKELRGWSAVGNLLDPSPALVRLSVTRLKMAFYGFANEKYRTLAAPVRAPAEDQLAWLRVDLHQAAFGEYREYLDNDLVREATDSYVDDLAGALLLPRTAYPRFQPRLYQLDGARFVAERAGDSEAPFGLLMDQPGMGKSLTTLWGLAAAGVERFIIVAPLTVADEVWTTEMLRVAYPQFPEQHVARDIAEALTLPRDGPVIAVLHYEQLLRHEEVRALAAPRADGSLPFDVIVFDEAHEVKERLGMARRRGPLKQGAWLLRAGARAAIGITATPLVNELYEPVSLLQLAKGVDDLNVGQRLRSNGVRDRVDVMEYMLADSLRRTKDDVLFEIPERRIETHPIVPSSKQLVRIRDFLSRGRRAVANDLTTYRKLMLEAKLDWIAREVGRQRFHLTDLGQPDPKVLVLCYNVDEVSDRVHERLAAEVGAERVRHVNGGTPRRDRGGAFDAFRGYADVDRGTIALVGTVGTVGVGVTLFDAGDENMATPHRVIFADLPFTWAEFEQSVDRLHRVGQRLPVQVDVPIVNFGDALTRADGELLKSFDGWVWDLLERKQLLADQVLDAAFDVSDYGEKRVSKAIRDMLRSLEKTGGAVVAPAPPEDSPAAEHRRMLGRYRALPRALTADLFRRDPEVSHRFLEANDASKSARLAHQLVRERLGRWLDRRSLIVDLGCGSNPLRDLPCQVIGIDRHGVNGGHTGDMTETGLSDGEADFVVMSLSMWGTPADRLAYLREAKRVLRPLSKLIIVEPSTPFGGPLAWQVGAGRLRQVSLALGMRLTKASEHTVDTGATLLSFVIDNSGTPPSTEIEPEACQWTSE